MQVETRVAQKRTSSGEELNNNKRHRKVADKIKPHKGTRHAKTRTPREQDNIIDSLSEEEVIHHRHATPRDVMKSIPQHSIRKSARIASTTSTTTSSSIATTGDIYRPNNSSNNYSQKKGSPLGSIYLRNERRDIRKQYGRTYQNNNYNNLDMSNNLNKLIWLIGITLCAVIGIFFAKMLLPGNVQVLLISSSVCGVVADSDQIGYRLDKPLNKLRLSQGSQPYAYDALNKYEKPRLREHMSSTFDSKQLGDFSENTRAVTLHFAGGGQMQLKHDTALKIGEALFIRNSEGSILNVVCSAKTDIHQLKVDIATQLYQCPRSVVILHDIEKLPTDKKMMSKFGNAAGLIVLERFFEDETVEVPEVGRIDMRQAVFILTSTLGSRELKNVSPRDFARRPTEDVIELIKKATRTWAAGRPALGGRLSNSQVPFI